MKKVNLALKKIPVFLPASRRHSPEATMTRRISQLLLSEVWILC